jgi:hypothetical protein
MYSSHLGTHSKTSELLSTCRNIHEKLSLHTIRFALKITQTDKTSIASPKMPKSDSGGVLLVVCTHLPPIHLIQVLAGSHHGSQH